MWEEDADEDIFIRPLVVEVWWDQVQDPRAPKFDLALLYICLFSYKNTTLLINYTKINMQHIYLNIYKIYCNN